MGMNDQTYYAGIADALARLLQRRPELAGQIEALLVETRSRLPHAQPARLRFAQRNYASAPSGRTLETKAYGADVLALVVLNPGRWVSLREGTWSWAGGRLTWRASREQPNRPDINASVKDVLKRLKRIDPELAKALSFADGRSELEEGLHLRVAPTEVLVRDELPDGTVQAMWLPRPGMKVDGTSGGPSPRPSAPDL